LFGGIVAGRGRVVNVESAAGAALRLVVDTACLPRRPGRGESVAVSGVCLTVVSRRGRVVSFDVIGETVRRTTLGDLRAGDEVNLENALRMGDPVGGHEISGHVDGVGGVSRVERRRDETRLTIAAPKSVHETLAPQGFVAVDGASLTVAALSRGSFTVALIPTTLEVTTLRSAVRGTLVNLEGDPVGRHVARWMRARRRLNPFGS
jgi:riboflavin synthase